METDTKEHLCTLCGQSRRCDHDITGTTNVRVSGGYGSPLIPDGASWTVDLCEYCFVAMIVCSRGMPRVTGYMHAEDGAWMQSLSESAIGAMRRGRPDQLRQRFHREGWEEMVRRCPFVPPMKNVPYGDAATLLLEEWFSPGAVLKMPAFFRGLLLWRAEGSSEPLFDVQITPPTPSKENGSLNYSETAGRLVVRYSVNVYDCPDRAQLTEGKSRYPDFRMYQIGIHTWWLVRWLDDRGIDTQIEPRDEESTPTIGTRTASSVLRDESFAIARRWMRSQGVFLLHQRFETEEEAKTAKSALLRRYSGSERFDPTSPLHINTIISRICGETAHPWVLEVLAEGRMERSEAEDEQVLQLPHAEARAVLAARGRESIDSQIAQLRALGYREGALDVDGTLIGDGSDGGGSSS